jgi:hypothetical protein
MLDKMLSDCDALEKDSDILLKRLHTNMERIEELLSPRGGGDDRNTFVESRESSTIYQNPGMYALQVSRPDQRMIAAASVSENVAYEVQRSDFEKMIGQLQQLRDEKERYKEAYNKLFIKCAAGPDHN